MTTFIRVFLRDQSGASLPLVAFCLFALLGSLGLAVDLGHYYVVQQELKNAADASALAGVRALFPYDMKSAADPLSPDCIAAVAVATQTAHSNSVDNAATIVADIQTGRWNPVGTQFIGPSCSSDPSAFTNAVRVKTHREDIPLFIMQLLGTDPRTLEATSVAVLEWVGGLKKGGGFPIAIAKKYAKTDKFTKIYLNDDNSDVGCWFLKGATDPGSFAETVKNIVLRQAEMPSLRKGEMIYMNNGVISVAEDFIGNSYIGKTVWLPVVDTIKYKQSIDILGFAGFRITEVGKDSGKHYIGGIAERLAEVPGDIVDSSGDDFGLLGGARLVY